MKLEFRKAIKSKIKDFGFFDKTIMWQDYIKKEKSEISDKTIILNILGTRYNDGKRFERAFILNLVIRGEKGENTLDWIEDKIIAYFNGHRAETDEIIIENIIFENSGETEFEKDLQAWVVPIKFLGKYRLKSKYEKINYQKMGEKEVQYE